MTEKKITFADTFKASDYEEEMNQLLLLIADFTATEDKQGWVDYCLVSDESQLRDFMPNGYLLFADGDPERTLQQQKELGEKLKELGEKLGFPVERRDYMAAIAAKMRQLGEQMRETN